MIQHGVYHKNMRIKYRGEILWTSHAQDCSYIACREENLRLKRWSAPCIFHLVVSILIIRSFPIHKLYLSQLKLNVFCLLEWLKMKSSWILPLKSHCMRTICKLVYKHAVAILSQISGTEQYCILSLHIV
jgi:hypothetical protein